MLRRPVTSVTRREPHTSGRVLHGEPPGGLLPPVPHRDLRAFVVRDQRPACGGRTSGCTSGLAFARATVTLREGRLIGRRPSLAELPGMGAPAEVVEDVTRRRYADPAPADGPGSAVARG
ncbi:hypothetical protein ACSP97_09580 [Streptomyces sp. SCPE 10]|uniref:hypothetical protein n=1 Tax=Streptomyces sp. SCPE 10 TaxID=3449273 RepID=UPI003F7D4FFA